MEPILAESKRSLHATTESQLRLRLSDDRWTTVTLTAHGINHRGQFNLRLSTPSNWFARAHKTATGRGKLVILVKPNARGRRLVKHHTYPVTLRLWVSYTPTGGRQRNIGYYGLHLP
jgi:hypothetical protein